MTPQEIYRDLIADPVELQVARKLHSAGETELLARALFKEAPLSLLPEPVVIKVLGHLRDLCRGLRA